MKIDITSASAVIDLMRESAEKGVFAALATSDVRGEARVRMIMLRGFLKDDGVGPAMISTTHGLSPKLKQIRRNARGEFVLWLESLRVQIRSRVSTLIVGPGTHETLRAKIWKNIPPQTQLPFWGPAPGTALIKVPATKLTPSPGKGVPAAFVALVMRMRELDVTQLAAGGNKRVKHVKTSRGWSTTEVVP